MNDFAQVLEYIDRVSKLDIREARFELLVTWLISQESARRTTVAPIPSTTEAVLQEFIIYLGGFGLGDEQIDNLERFLRERLDR